MTKFINKKKKSLKRTLFNVASSIIVLSSFLAYNNLLNTKTRLTAHTSGISSDVIDATITPKQERLDYTKEDESSNFLKQVLWLDLGDVESWSNIQNEDGKIYLNEGSTYTKEIIKDYVITLKVKSLKPFQATEIYRKRMEAANASEEEKATFNPNATNQRFGDFSGQARIFADKQSQWSEIQNNGVNTGEKKTAIGSETWSNIGIQFEISGTYKGKTVQPAVVITDSESANAGEEIIFTTNGDGWERVVELKKKKFIDGSFEPTLSKPINLHALNINDYPQIASKSNFYQLLWSMHNNTLSFSDGSRLMPKYMTNPDQTTGGLGTGVFGPVTTSGGYSVPVLMTKNATEVGMYILSSGQQTAMLGFTAIDEGDAPKSYGSAYHTISSTNTVDLEEVHQPYLGDVSPDMDTRNLDNWTGDDSTTEADEGVNQLLPDHLKGDDRHVIQINEVELGHYMLNVKANTGGAESAYVKAWVDFNQNGKFDDEESSELTKVTKNGSVAIHFRNKTQFNTEELLEAGTRVRIAANESDVINPVGHASTGEVEDFISKLAKPPFGEKKTTIGNIYQTQRAEIHFTAQGKNLQIPEHPDAMIDVNVQPIYIDNKSNQKITLSSENTYTVEGEGTYKFILSENQKDIKVEFTPVMGFLGKAHGITIRRYDTNGATTQWETYDPTTLPNINDVINTMDGLYIPEVIPPTPVKQLPATGTLGTIISIVSATTLIALSIILKRFKKTSIN